MYARLSQIHCYKIHIVTFVLGIWLIHLVYITNQVEEIKNDFCQAAIMHCGSWLFNSAFVIRIFTGTRSLKRHFFVTKMEFILHFTRNKLQEILTSHSHIY